MFHPVSLERAALVSQPAPSNAISTPSYGLNGAQIGMSIGAWRSASRQQGSDACAPKASDPHETICSGAPIALGGGYLAKNITYTFADDRLTKIMFQTSVDGFDYATAMLKRRYGDPLKIIRDTVKLSGGSVFPHVLMTWRTQRSTIRLSDPEAGGDILIVSIEQTMDAARPLQGV